jgi:hypothetical protein
VRGEHLAPREDRTASVPTLIEPLVVHRSTLRTWLISLAAIPAIVVGVDVLWRRRIVSWLTEAIFDSDPQTLEARDEIWAWTMVVVGAAVVVWGLKELFFPSPVLQTDDEGLSLRLNGPLRPPIRLVWSSLYDIDAGTLEDDEEEVEVLIVEVKDPALLPSNPWAGRRVNETTLALFTTEWDTTAEEAASKIADQAVTVARLAPPPG